MLSTSWIAVQWISVVENKPCYPPINPVDSDIHLSNNPGQLQIVLWKKIVFLNEVCILLNEC